MKKLFLSLLIFAPFLSQANSLDNLEEAIRDSDVKKTKQLLEQINISSEEKNELLDLAKEIIICRREKYFYTNSEGPDHLVRSIVYLTSGTILLGLIPISIPLLMLAYSEKEKFFKECEQKHGNALTIKRLISMKKPS